jgi:hypothetical protein
VAWPFGRVAGRYGRGWSVQGHRTGEGDVDKVAQWTVTIDIDEHDGHTRAVARLHTLDTERMVGVASRPRPYPGEQPRTNADGVRMAIKTRSVAFDVKRAPRALARRVGRA